MSSRWGLTKTTRSSATSFVHLGKMMDAIRDGVDPREAYEKNIGTYGRFDEAVRVIDPDRKE